VIITEAPSGRLLHGNRFAEQLFGRPLVPAGTVMQYDAYQGLHPDGRPYRPHEWPTARTVAFGEVVTDEEILIPHPDGSRRTALVSAKPIRDRTGRVVAAVTTSYDLTERKHAVDALRAADVRLRSHIEHSPLAVIEWDHELRVSQWSPRAEQIFGWSAAEVIGKRRHEWQLVVEDDDAHVQSAIAPFLTGAPAHDNSAWEVHTNRNLTKDGRTIECEWYNSFLYDEAGRFTSILSLVQDVTARKRTEEALRLSEARLKAQYQSIPLPTTTWQRVDEDFVLIDYNQAASDISSGIVERYLGGRARDIHHDDPEFVAGLSQSFTARTVCQQERFQRLKTTGAHKYFKITYAFAPPDLVMVHREDLTARKQAEDAQRFLFEVTPQLVSSLEYEKTLAQVAQLVIPFLADWCEVYTKDPQGQIHCLAVAHVDPTKVHWARELQRRYPLPPDAPYGIPQVLRTGKSEIFSEIPDALLVDAARGDAELLHILRTVGLSSAMAVPMVAQGRVLGAINFVAAESGRRYGAADLALAEELARRAALAVDNARLYREAQEAQQVLVRQAEALSRSNAELEQFAYVASHDLQEPLRMVTTYVQLLAKRYQASLDAEAHEFIGYAVEGATRMKALIDDLLDFSRVERQGKEFASFDCGPLVQRTLRDLQAVIRQREALIEVDSLPTVYGDEPQVGQVFQNLLSNALKFCTARPRIRISARRKGQYWVFGVHDNGIGIAPQQAERIFVLFQRLHTRQEYPGTGIGLAICKKIVERHGGKLWVESEVDKGATFFFTLPVA
jgi:PAS domain S-box-containing protein